MKILCPNCEAEMEQGGACPQCTHEDGKPDCDCAHCTRLRPAESSE